jgi:hypothetical protein
MTYLEHLQAVFFGAANAGYAANAPKTTMAELPGSKVITYEEDDFLVKDVYFVNKATYQSFGSKMIWDKRCLELGPVWFMSYDGWYHPSVTNFLKETLACTYAKHFFNGGRGEDCVNEAGSLSYGVRFDASNRFSFFRGNETIERDVVHRGGGSTNTIMG